MTVFPAGNSKPLRGGVLWPEPQRRDTGEGSGSLVRVHSGLRATMVCAVPVTAGLQGRVRAQPTKCPSTAPGEGRLGHSPQAAEDGLGEDTSPLRSCKSRWPGEGGAAAVGAASFQLPRRRV